MANGTIEIINAPAGSGKTTQIEKEIKGLINNNLKSKVLCLTYTNRATDELNSRFKSSKVDVLTIHSFLQKETKQLFKKKYVVDFYFEFFSDKINIELANETKRMKYEAKYNVCDVSFEAVRQNCVSIKYNERNSSRYLYGELSHYDLLLFVSELNDKVDYFKMKIGSRYSYIYLDEYQDTDESIIKFLNEVVSNNKINPSINWKLFGDNMQQIYSIDNAYLKLNAKKSTLNKNFRSSNTIIELLNNLYVVGGAPTELRVDNPYIEITPIINLYDEEQSIESLKRDKSVNLSSNYKEIFNLITDGSQILESFQNITKNGFKIYGYLSEMQAHDLLLNLENWTKDEMLNHYLVIVNLQKYYNEKKWANFLSYFREQKLLKQSVINIRSNKDKENMICTLEKIFGSQKCKDENIVDYISGFDCLFKLKFKTAVNESDLDYDFVEKNVKTSDLQILLDYIESVDKPFDVSTQHGVKGESHRNVNIICEDNIHSDIDYNLFFRVYSLNELDLNIVENELILLQDKVKKLFDILGISSVKDLDKEIYTTNIQHFEKFRKEVEELKLEYSELFLDTSGNENKTGVTKYIRSINNYRRYLITFKIFYVGCSRVREELVVNIPQKYVSDYYTEFCNKFESIGFEVSSAINFGV